jgi:hypothetical protein
VEVLARPRLALLSLVLVLPLAAATTARAAGKPHVDSVVRPDGTTVIRFVAAKGEVNEVQMRIRAEELDPYKRQQGVLEDTGVDFYDVESDGIAYAGPLCGPQGTGVGCDVVGTKVAVEVDLADKDDLISPQYDAGRLIPATIKGGAGVDALQVWGPNPTAIDWSGGAGIDAVDYFDPKRRPLSFNDDRFFNDGRGHDRIRDDVELFVGGDGNDRFSFAGSNRHIVFGTLGDDTMVSGPGPDVLDGGYGADPAGTDAPSNDTVTYAARGTGVTVTLDGVANDGTDSEAEGDDVLPTVEHVVGTFSADTLVGPNSVPDGRAYRLDGLGGADVLSGGAGLDLIDAGPDNDVVVTKGGGQDAIKCGTGDDLLVSDTVDESRDCERVTHSYLGAAAAQRGDAVAGTVAVPVPASKVTITLTSGSSSTVLGSLAAELPAGLRSFAVPLNRAGKQALAKSGSLPLKVRAQIASPGRKSVSSTKTVTLAKR